MKWLSTVLDGIRVPLMKMHVYTIVSKNAIKGGCWKSTGEPVHQMSLLRYLPDPGKNGQQRTAVLKQCLVAHNFRKEQEYPNGCEATLFRRMRPGTRPSCLALLIYK